MTTVTWLMASSLDAPAGASPSLPPVPCSSIRIQLTGDDLAVGVASDPGTASPSHHRPGGASLPGMDQRSEIREFLASRRARITPQQAGLPAYGANRRVPGLRREEVALLAGVSVDYYTQMERGNLGGVSGSILDALAGALQLDEAERAHLFDLAGTANTPARPRRPSGPQRVRPSIQRLLDAMTGVPAYVRTVASTSWPSTGSGMPCTRPSWPASSCRSTWPGSYSSTPARATSTSPGTRPPMMRW